MASVKSGNTIKLVRRDDVKRLANCLKHLDQNGYALLANALIPNDLYDKHSQYPYLPETTVKKLIQMLGAKTTPQEFAALLCQVCKTDYIPKLAARLTPGNTLQASLAECGQQLRGMNSGANIYTQQQGGKWWLVREKSGTDEAWFKYAEMFVVIFICELLKYLTQGKWQPQEIGLQCSDMPDFGHLPELTNTQFYTHRAVTAVYIPTDIMLSSAVLPATLAIREEEPVTAAMSFLESFELAIRPYLSAGKLPIKLAAQIVNINVRTLQRRLAQEGLIYSDLIEALVFDQVIELLSNTDLPITVIAITMGYSDAAHFTRACKRYLGVTPRQYRAKKKNQQF